MGIERSNLCRHIRVICRSKSVHDMIFVRLWGSKSRWWLERSFIGDPNDRHDYDHHRFRVRVELEKRFESDTWVSTRVRLLYKTVRYCNTYWARLKEGPGHYDMSAQKTASDFQVDPEVWSALICGPLSEMMTAGDCQRAVGTPARIHVNPSIGRNS